MKSQMQYIICDKTNKKIAAKVYSKIYHLSRSMKQQNSSRKKLKLTHF